jgi:NodT family efflux transporter outer membrane factor (OMF) lipoprotein
MARGFGLALALVAALGGCTMAPPYHPPVMSAPAAFDGAGPWVPARPAQASPGSWWHAFSDPALADLETRLDRDNPSLAQALARHEAARAALTEARAGLMPQVDLGGSALANRQSANRPLRGSNQPDRYAADTVDAAGGYELDLWGRVRASVAAARARSTAADDDLAAVRLALETELARTYLELRGYDRLIALFETTVDTYARADRLIRNRLTGGIASGLDLGRADAQLADARAQLADLRASRAITEHALAALVGTPATGFALDPQAGELALPALPAVLPSTLLQRRPDVAAAERRMFAANQEIGVARAAWFPQLSLSGLVGFQNMGAGPLLAAPNLFWAVGPGVALNLFDGGRRLARVRLARAQWDNAAADYRRVALAAFAQVEDDLALLHHLGEANAAQREAVDGASRAGRLAMIRYDKGAADFLEVAVALANELAARRRAIQLATRAAQAHVDLVRALGGGWQPDAAANPPAAAR